MCNLRVVEVDVGAREIDINVGSPEKGIGTAQSYDRYQRHGYLLPK